MGGDQAFRICLVGGDGLFDHGMHPLIHRGNPQCSVLKMRRGNDDRIHQAGANQFFTIPKNFERFILIQLPEYGIGYGNQFSAIHLPGG